MDPTINRNGRSIEERGRASSNHHNSNQGRDIFNYIHNFLQGNMFSHKEKEDIYSDSPFKDFKVHT